MEKIKSANLIAQIRQNLAADKITFSGLCVNINALRVKCGIKKRITKQAISRILSGKRKASIDIILEILYATDNPKSTIAGGDAGEITDV